DPDPDALMRPSAQADGARQPATGSHVIRDVEKGRHVRQDGIASGRRQLHSKSGRGKMAHPKRFELLTPRFVVWCSIQLSYGCAPPCGQGRVSSGSLPGWQVGFLRKT